MTVALWLANNSSLYASIIVLLSLCLTITFSASTCTYFIIVHIYRPDLDLSGTGQPQTYSIHPITRCRLFIQVANSSELLDRSAITGPCWDPYWVVSVLSPILFLVLNVKASLLIIKDERVRKFFIIHILAVIVSSYWVYSNAYFILWL